MSWLDNEFELVPTGWHAVKFDDCELDETGDVPKLTLKFKAKGHETSTLFMNIKFTESSKKWIAWQILNIDKVYSTSIMKLNEVILAVILHNLIRLHFMVS